MDIINRDKTNIKTFLIILYYILLLFTGIVPSSLLTMAFCIIMFFLFPYEEFMCLFPGMIIYYSYFIVPLIGISLYRLYSFLLLFKVMYAFIKREIGIRIDSLLILVPLLSHALLSVFFENVRIGIFYVLDLILIFLLFSENYITESQTKRLFSLFAIACASSVFSGFMLGNTMSLSYELGTNQEATTRFMGTFVDPNYCGFWYGFCILFCIISKPFKIWQRRIIVVMLFIGVLMTISFTSYISLAVMILIYAILYKKLNVKTLGYVVTIGVVLLGLFIYGTNNPDTPVLGDISYRIQSYTADYEQSAEDSKAASRANIWKIVYREYEKQPISKKIFGMNPHVPSLNLNSSDVIPAHNDYMEMLYNCGLILTMIFYLGIFMRILKSYEKYKREKNEISSFVFMSKVSWLVFSFALSLISERVFMPILFL